MSAPTLILICGYARAGKDTFADGIVSAVDFKKCWRESFADPLKDAANDVLKSLGVYQVGVCDFYNEKFKEQNRHMLVAIGQVARSIDRDVFVRAFCKEIQSVKYHHGLVVVTPDCRYLNELNFCRINLPGWNIKTVLVSTAGVTAANEEEGKSLGDIFRNHAFDAEYQFAPNSADAVRKEGRDFGLSLRS